LSEIDPDKLSSNKNVKSTYTIIVSKLLFNNYCTCKNESPNIILCEYCEYHLKLELPKWKEINHIIDKYYNQYDREKSKILLFGEFNKCDVFETLKSKNKSKKFNSDIQKLKQVQVIPESDDDDENTSFENECLIF